MATDIELFRSGSYEPIDYSRFSVEIVTSAIAPTPSASVTTQANEQIDVNQDCRIVIDGTIVFEGQTESAGSINRNGQVDLSVVHPHDALFEERVSLSLSGTVTAIDVLEAALTNSNRGDATMLSWSGSDVTLDSGYDVENRKLTAIFRDMTDRTGRVWWVDPSGTTINVEPKGDRGTWKAIDTQADKAVVETYDDGSVATVRNDVTVIATGAEAVSATATDATSISEYGRRSEEINIGYAATAGEAQAYADELIIPDPLASATVLVTEQIGDVTQPLANFTIDLTDDGKNIDTSGLVIEKQTLEQGRVTLEVGEGSGVSIENVNRGSKSQDDTTEPGSVYGNDRLGDDSVNSDQLVDSSVIENKLADLSVSLQKVQDGAIDTVKITDNAVQAPKILAGAITAEKLDTELARAQRLLAGQIEALDIATNTLTANEIDTLDLDTGQLTIGANTDSPIIFTVETFGSLNIPQIHPQNDGEGILGTNTQSWREAYIQTVTGDSASFSGTSVPLTLSPSGTVNSIFVTERSGVPTIEPEVDDVGAVGNSTRGWSEVWAHEFYDAGTGTVINDGGDVLAGLADGHGPPDHCVKCDEDGNDIGTDISELSHTLMDICREQQRHIEDQSARIDDLESRLEHLEATVGDNA